MALVLLAALAGGLAVLPALAIPTNSSETHQLHARASFPYGGQKVRGVSLGGWLVLEPWITPSLFERTGNNAIVDEYTFGQFQDRGRASAALNQHWNSWITESDFSQIAAAGLNHVRIPIGYWAFDVSGGEPYIQGQLPFLDRAVGWARNHGLKVMVDLHGAPGSQNGFDNSGQRGGANWPNNWNNVVRAKNVLTRIAQRYASAQDVVSAIQLLNEPAGWYGDYFVGTTKQFWYDGYGTIRENGGYLTVLHDAFLPLSSWNNFMPPPQWQGVAMDTHHYQVFTPSQVAQSLDQHIQQTCALAGEYAGSTLWLIVGEWSLASTDCAQYLNGRGRGSRYEGQYDGGWYVGNCRDRSGDGSTFSNEYKAWLRKFFDIQTQTYERYAQGWIHWTWKNERAAEWSYQQGLRQGWIPRNPGQHVYNWDQVCGN